MLPSSVLWKPQHCIRIMQITVHLSGRNKWLCHLNSVPQNTCTPSATLRLIYNLAAVPHNIWKNTLSAVSHNRTDQKFELMGGQKPTLNSSLIVSLFSRSCCRNGRISSKRWSSFKSCGTPTRWSIEAATCANTQHGWVFLCVGGRLNAFQKPRSGKRMYWPANTVSIYYNSSPTCATCHLLTAIIPFLYLHLSLLCLSLIDLPVLLFL